MKTLVHGTPITPRARLADMAGASFCVSLADPRDASICLEITDTRGGFTMLDNGAFSTWKRGETFDAATYYEWAGELLELHPSARAVCPDVIGGTTDENLELLASCPLDMARTYVVWHMNESLELLAWYADRFPLIAFGSCADFDIITQPRAWEARAATALAVARKGAAAPELHMMRGLNRLADFDFDSADSTNIARNATRQLRSAGKSQLATRVETERLELKVNGAAGVARLWSSYCLELTPQQREARTPAPRDDIQTELGLAYDGFDPRPQPDALPGQLSFDN